MRKNSQGKTSSVGQINVDDLLPVNGHAVSLSNRANGGSANGVGVGSISSRPGTTSREDQMSTMSRLSSKYQHRKAPTTTKITNGHHDDLSPPRSPKYPSTESIGTTSGSKSAAAGLLLRPAKNSPFSSRTKNGRMIDSNSADSTPYSNSASVPSVPSSYEYDDDFTSTDEEAEEVSVKFNNNSRSAQSQRTISSSTSAGSLSRIPIKRNSSLRRKKQVMDNYRPPIQPPPQTPLDLDQQLPTEKKLSVEKKMTTRDPRSSIRKVTATTKKVPYSRSPAVASPPRDQSSAQSYYPEPRHNTLPRPRQPYLRRKSPSKSLERTKKRTSTTAVAASNNTKMSRVYSKSVGTLNKTDHASNDRNGRGGNGEELEVEEDIVVADSEPDPFTPKMSLSTSPALSRKTPPLLPPGGKSQQKDESETAVDAGSAASSANFTPASATPKMPPAAEMSSAAAAPPDSGFQSSATTRLSTAGSTISMSGNYAHVQLKTQVTLKSPFEGANLGPAPIKPSAFLAKSMEEMSSGDWDVNVKGMTGVMRLILHHTDHIVLEYKEVMQLIMKHVMNLRSQVCRAAVICVCEMFVHLRRNMEQDLEKIALPLISKTGDTNKFLREDCHLALDVMVDNLSPARVIAVITTDDVVNHKSPTIRGTVARLLAYSTERMGVARALTSPPQAGITEKLVPAVAKLAQDGSQDARSYAKYTLVMFMEQSADVCDLDRVLRKNTTPNTMRNLEKIMDSLRQPARGGGKTPGFGSTLSRGSSRRKGGGKSRKTL